MPAPWNGSTLCHVQHQRLSAQDPIDGLLDLERDLGHRLCLDLVAFGEHSNRLIECAGHLAAERFQQRLTNGV